MGLLRRVESGIEDAVGGRGRRTPGPPVQPGDLARKLLKEMEDHKVALPTRISVMDRYTIYLCPADWDRLRGKQAALALELKDHLQMHVRSKGYQPAGELEVIITSDDDLRSGQFGILAEQSDDRPPALAQVRAVPGAPVVPDAPVVPHVRLQLGGPVSPDPLYAALPAASAAGPAAASGQTQMIAAGDADRMDLARQTLVLRHGNRTREFVNGRVVIGRSKDADFRLSDPNVSRRHAAIFWENGRPVLEDLDSTNGTFVNGRPVRRAALSDGDAIAMGASKISVGTK